MTRFGLFLGIAPRNGGMFQYAQSLLAALEAMAGDDFVVAYTEQLWAPILKRYRGKHVHLSNAGVGQKLASALMALRVPGKLTRSISTFNPIVRQLDGLACDFWIFPAQDALSYQIRGKSIFVIHDLMHRYEGHFPEVSQAGRFGVREHRFKNGAAAASGILVDSVVGRHQVMESYGTSPAKIWPLPYVPGEHVLSPQVPPGFEQRHHLPEKFLFYPAQFWAHKNHLRLLEAVAMVSQTCPDIRLVCSGGHSNAYEAVKQRAVELGIGDKVLFPGYVPDEDVAGFYNRARALVMPTFFGPTNIPPMEAFACGCPVAISDIYGMPEQAAGAALLFDPKNLDSIAEAIKALWIDDALCARLAQKGRDVSSRWRQPDFNARFASILASIAAGEQNLA